MRILPAQTLALALFIAPVVAATQSTLPFSPQPKDIPSVADFAGPQVEGNVTNNDVKGSLERGQDEVIKWLVAHKVCDAAKPTCPFRLHLSNAGDKPGEEVTHYAVRYALRGADGTTVEGFCLAPVGDKALYRYWHRSGDTWTELTDEKDKDAEYSFLSDLSELASGLVAMGQLEISQ